MGGVGGVGAGFGVEHTITAEGAEEGVPRENVRAGGDRTIGVVVGDVFGQIGAGAVGTRAVQALETSRCRRGTGG